MEGWFCLGWCGGGGGVGMDSLCAVGWLGWGCSAGVAEGCCPVRSAGLRVWFFGGGVISGV